MKESDLGLILTIAGLGAAAYFLLRTEPAKGDGSAWEAPIYGTGTALREPVPITVPEPPSIVERLATGVIEFFTPKVREVPYKDPTQWRRELQPLFRAQEKAYAMPEGFLEAVATVESSFRHDIITCETLGGVGEQGIMQIDPKWHPPPNPPGSWCDPEQSIKYAAQFLAKNFMRFGSWSDAIAAYNWGPTNLAKHGINAAPAKTKQYIATVKSQSEDFA